MVTQISLCKCLCTEVDDYRWTRSGDGFGLGREDARTAGSRLEGFVREHRIDIGSDRNHSKSLRLDEDGDELTILLNYQKERDVNDMFRPGSFSTNIVRKNVVPSCQAIEDCLYH